MRAITEQAAQGYLGQIVMYHSPVFQTRYYARLTGVIHDSSDVWRAQLRFFMGGYGEQSRRSPMLSEIITQDRTMLLDYAW